MKDLAKAVAAHRRANALVEQARAALHAAILEALADGVTQADLARQTGYTRERLRQIARAATRESV